ncbi:MAG: hldE 1 [Chthoniobacter sp.]|nr:hldE 1 [Chthoniobacter sp.]
MEGFRGKRVLVIGDLMLDEFLWGRVSRISPEAPVPVVEVVRQEWFPGGAANVARNLAEFCSGVSLMGVTGLCTHATLLKDLLLKDRIAIEGVQFHGEYQTVVKTRVIARQQHVVRIDRESRLELRELHAERLLEHLDRALPNVDAVILEDYGKGLLTEPLALAICDKTHKAGRILAIDPNPHNPVPWRHASVIKPNRSEAFAGAGIPPVNPTDDPTQETALQAVGKALMRKWNAENLLITLGEQGVILFTHGRMHHAPTRAREVFDVSGAGDTMIALFTLALSAGAAPEEAAELANHASGIAVGKLGTATVTPAELLASFAN